MVLNKDLILVVDFGAQYSHLIARRIRDQGVKSEIVPYNISIDNILALNPKGIIFSGGPASIYSANAPKPNPEILNLDIPILGICYGLQFIVDQKGGKVVSTKTREYGKSELLLNNKSNLFSDVKNKSIIWMSHSDKIVKINDDFEVLSHTSNSPYAAIKIKNKNIFGVQFHPEVIHTKCGNQIFDNFVYKICNCNANWQMDDLIDEKINIIKNMVGSNKVLCAVSGGVDSTTAAVLLNQALGKNLYCVFVNHGLLREGESKRVVDLLKNKLKLNLTYVDASKSFLSKLQGIQDPEKKRKIVGNEFIEVFSRVAKDIGKFKWLVQGTLYPDIIESAVTNSLTSKIKSHHNVGGLPEKMNLKLIEPFKDLYKDEVRKIAKILKLPRQLIYGHPFPGPGLSVRIIGEITNNKIKICRHASAIIEQELINTKLYDKVWQAFAIIGDDKAVGILGDQRHYGYVVTIKILESEDAMTADWTRLPYKILEKISNRITNEVNDVTLVTYAVSSKPPSTIEPQ